jgi:hypothetical protein
VQAAPRFAKIWVKRINLFLFLTGAPERLPVSRRLTRTL